MSQLLTQALGTASLFVANRSLSPPPYSHYISQSDPPKIQIWQCLLSSFKPLTPLLSLKIKPMLLSQAIASFCDLSLINLSTSSSKFAPLPHSDLSSKLVYYLACQLHMTSSPWKAIYCPFYPLPLSKWSCSSFNTQLKRHPFWPAFIGLGGILLSESSRAYHGPHFIMSSMAEGWLYWPSGSLGGSAEPYTEADTQKHMEWTNTHAKWGCYIWAYP